MAPTHYIGRQRELALLKALLQKKSASLVVIKGRRRIGKSRLVTEFAKGLRFLSFSGLPPTEGLTAQSQRNEFMRMLAAQTPLPSVQATDWGDVFDLLASQIDSGPVLIFFDEISWMGQDDPEFLGKLKNAWDLSFKQNPELILILCGSVSSWIERNILGSAGFVGRISLSMQLTELSLDESREFIKDLSPHTSARDQLKILSVTGGVPRYLEEIIPNRPAEELIKSWCFTREGVLLQEFEALFTDLFSKKSKIYKRILNVLIAGPKELNEICKALDWSVHGGVSEYLNDLRTAGFIQRDFTWNIQDHKESRLSHYRVSDNYVRFYLKYIAPNQGKIEGGYFDDRSIANLPNWDGIMGLQFENLILNNRLCIWKALGIAASDIVIDGPFFQRKTSRIQGCQIDYLIQTRYNGLFVCEIKFSRNEVGSSVIDQVKEKINRISLPRSFSTWPVLIHVGGVAEAVFDAEYFAHIIDFLECS